MPKKRKPNIRFGWLQKQKAMPVECRVCGQALRLGIDDFGDICKGCSGPTVQRKRKKESEDDETADDRDEFREAWNSMRGEWNGE